MEPIEIVGHARRAAEKILTRDGESEWKTVMNMPAFESAMTEIKTMAAGVGLDLRVQVRPKRE